MANVLSHNERAAATWGSGGRDYERVSEGVLDALTHLVNRIDPQQGERFLGPDPGDQAKITEWLTTTTPCHPKSGMRRSAVCNDFGNNIPYSEYYRSSRRPRFGIVRPLDIKCGYRTSKR